jgi:hypothetical protein
MSTSQITVQAPTVKRCQFNIVGITPLICHRFDEKARKMMLDKQQKKASSVKVAKDPEQDYLRSLYVMEDGRYGFPVTGLKAAMVRAAKAIDGLTMTDARALFFVEADGRCPTGEQCIAISGEPQMREDVVRLNGKTADLRYRGEFTEWSADVTIKYDADMINEESLAALLVRAGLSVGIGEWRPEKNGDFGQFTL